MRTRQRGAFVVGGNHHASERVVFCRTHVSASSLIRCRELHAGVRGSRFLQVDPVEGGSANDYDYVWADPVNQFDLDGTHCGKTRTVTNKKTGKKNTVSHEGHWNSWRCKGARAAAAVGRGAVAGGRAVAKGAVAAGKDFGRCVTGQPCVIGTIGNYVAVNGALVTMAGLGVFAGLMSCTTVIGCLPGGTLGFGGAGAAGYGLYAYNRAFWKKHG